MSSLVAFNRLRPLVALVLVAAFAAAAAAAETVLWKFSPNLTNHYQMSQDTKVVKTGAGGDMQVDTLLTIDMSWTVKEVKPDGSAVLEQRIGRMRMSVQSGDGANSEGGGMKSEIDTAATEDPQGQAAMAAPLLKAITSNAFIVTMTPRGEVTDVVVPEAVAEALKNQPGAAQMGELASAEGFKKLVGQAAFVLPETLEPGQEWTGTTEAKLPLIGTLTAVTTYKYEGPAEVEGQQLAKFSAQVDASFAGGDVTVEVPSQESKGEILFDGEAGRLASSAINHVMNLKMTANGEIVEQKIDQTIGVKWLAEPAK